MAANYNEVVDQLQAFGLEVERLEVGKLVRCRTADDKGRQKTGWYSLREWRTREGEFLLVGAFGDWREGTATHKVELKGHSFSAEERAAYRVRLAEDKKKAEAQRKAQAARAARRAVGVFRRCASEGESAYLAKKGVKGYGVRYSPQGDLVIPICDARGEIQGLQIIYDDPATKERKGRDKDYWPAGLQKRGAFHLIGAVVDTVIVVEGYATGASIHQALGEQVPVAVAFDAGNLLPAAQALHKRYKRARILIGADDDFATFQNPGVTAASTAAMAVGGEWLAPRFSADPLREAVNTAIEQEPPQDREAWKALITPLITGRRKMTDYNDLHQAEGLAVVRSQIEVKLEAMGWTGERAPVAGTLSGGAGERLKSLLTVDEACERYSLIYGGKATMFDHQEHMLVPKGDVLDILPDHGWREWKSRPDRLVSRLSEVGFDPACTDPGITCNLWAGWPTTPKAGRCTILLELLEYLCGVEDNPAEIYQWLLKWLAYPLQNPGAKMKTAVVMHGPQGAGKNLFFETIQAIYGDYGMTLDQDAVEDKFNDWASRKLFLIADEVVARMELYHTKNKLKGLITGDQIRINPKNVAAHSERNHVNLVFLSNEIEPLVLERDDRRYAVVWTPPKMDKRFYQEVADEIAAGGIAALHHHLLSLDLGDFRPWTEPPMTKAKRELMDLGMASTERFWRSWIGQEIDGVPVVPCKSQDLYQLYRDWCSRVGYSRAAPEPRLLAEIGKRSDATKRHGRYLCGSGVKQAIFIFPPEVEQPPDKTQPVWLGQCMEDFRAGVSAWKDENGAHRA